MRLKTLNDWLSYIESLHPQTIELGLDRIKIVANHLKITSFPCPILTVAGTNGKGSCTAFLAAILKAAGYRAGAYTSPHLMHFEERLHIDGKPVDAQLWLDAFSQVEKGRENTQLTYFEFTTLAALLICKTAQLDAVILEVGLGGRLDAVNILDSDIAIITTIALDHQEWLGNDREAIGKEKAGIMRSSKPAICGDWHPPQSIFTYAQEKNVPLYCVGKDFHYTLNTTDNATWQWESAKVHYTNLPVPHLPLQNAATALMALQFLPARFKISDAAIKQGLSIAWLPGRFQTLTQFSVPVIVDVAHNPAAATLLAERLQEQPIAGKTLAVVSILADKDITGTLRPLLPLIDTWFIAPLPVARGSSAEDIANHLRNLGVTAYHIDTSVVAALQHALHNCHQKDRILVYGSFHTVAAVGELYGI